MSGLLNQVFLYLAIILDWVQRGLMYLFKFDVPIKGNIEKDGTKLYYLPTHYAYTEVEVSLLKGERYFLSEDAAVKAGWKKAE